MRLSYSSLETYNQCPLKYKYREIDKLKEPKSKEAVFGTLIHSTLKFAYEPALVSPTLEQALDYFARGWNSEIWENELEERAAFSQGVDILTRYYKHNDPAKATVVALENAFQLEIEDPAKPGAVHTVKGFIDRIDKTDDGYEIIDYKTAKKMPSQDYVDQHLQLTIYLKAFLERYPKEKANLDKITVSLYFLKHGVKLSSRRTAEDLARVDELFLEAIRRIEAGEFEPRVSPLCDWCGFQKLCPMWRHKFKDARKIDPPEVNQAIEEYIATKRDLQLGKLKIAQLQEKINEYMDQEDVERVFGESAIVERGRRETWKYDAEKLRAFLEPRGLWERVIKPDGIALKKALSELPATERKAIEAEAKTLDKTSVTFKVKKLKGGEDDENEA